MGSVPASCMYNDLYQGNAVHCGASVNELHDALEFHSTTFSYLHTVSLT